MELKRNIVLILFHVSYRQGKQCLPLNIFPKYVAKSMFYQNVPTRISITVGTNLTSLHLNSFLCYWEVSDCVLFFSWVNLHLLVE